MIAGKDLGSSVVLFFFEAGGAQRRSESLVFSVFEMGNLGLQWF